MATSNPEDLQYKDIIKLQRLAKKQKLFLIQKLSRRNKQLKSKKGSDQQLKKNQRKVERLCVRINELKALDLKTVTETVINNNFKHLDNEDCAEAYFINELLGSKSEFMNFVNSLNGLLEDKIERSSEVGQKEKSNFKSNNHTDHVLESIFSTKKNRPGQRERRKKWEEMYGKKAKHLNSSSVCKKNPVKLDQSDKLKSIESAQKIMKRLKSSSNVREKEHPSWAAKRKQAADCNKIHMFSGKKTIFNDSDDDS